MDLLGGYNSDSDSDESSAPVPVKTTPAPVSKLTPPSESKADKKKRVVGKKLLKLSSVLPEHILNQLQHAGGGKSKSNESDDDDSDSSSDDEDQMPQRKTTPKAAAAPASRDYSRDEGIMGLLSALSKSNASSRKPSKILGNTELYSQKSDEEPSTISSPEPLEKQKATTTTTTKSEPLGAAFLTSTVETVVRKKKEPAAVRSIHGDSTSTASVNVSNPQSFVPRPTARVAPPQPRVQTASSLRSAAPAVRHPYTMHPPSRQPESYESAKYHNSQQPQRGQHQHKKKKPLSRKRQMEQMLRAGKLDQVEGDHQLSGVSHVYTMEGDALPPAAATSHTSSAGVRVVPTGSYDPSLGATSMSTDVTSRQKTTNQLNSLLANAASLESHRAQNPQYHLGVAKKAGSQRATAKRKYGW